MEILPVYGIIDTNVLVSALLSSSSFSNPFLILSSIYTKKIIPVYNDSILTEYKTVLSRKKFHFSQKQIELVITSIIDFGIKIENHKIFIEDQFPDPKDIVFYEVRMAVDDSYLVTGNIKHFPRKPFVVTPAQMVEILKEKGLHQA